MEDDTKWSIIYSRQKHWWAYCARSLFSTKKISFYAKQESETEFVLKKRVKNNCFKIYSQLNLLQIIHLDITKVSIWPQEISL